MHTRTQLVVTRPEPQAGDWVAQLAARGIAAAALPLVEIAPAADPQAVLRARAAWQGARAALFVSGQAVQHFFGSDWPVASVHASWNAIETRAWAPGPHTADALRAQGMPARLVDAPPADAAQFDSEHLWPVVAHQVHAGDTVLLVRGSSEGADPQAGSGRDWLAARIAERGGRVLPVAVYRRRVPHWSPAQHAQAEAARAVGSAWLFSSSESLGALARLMPGADWSGSAALATHPRIAEAARSAGFGRVQTVQPGLASVVASIESAR